MIDLKLSFTIAMYKTILYICKIYQGENDMALLLL